MLGIVKSAATLVAATGVAAVVTHAIKATTPDDLKSYSKVAVFIGTAVASRAIGDLAATWTVKQIDDLIKGYNHVKTTVNALKTEPEKQD